MWFDSSTQLQNRTSLLLTSTVFPAPCTPFSPRKNGGGFGFPAWRTLCNSNLASKNGMQCWDLSSNIESILLSLSSNFIPGIPMIVTSKMLTCEREACASPGDVKTYGELRSYGSLQRSLDPGDGRAPDFRVLDAVE